MTRTERLLAILQMLREQRQPVTAARIGERFNISERTAYRDIATLTRRGATIVGEAGVGFMLRDDFFIPPLAFDANEAAAILLGLRFVLRRGDDDLAHAAANARAKLAAVLPALFEGPGAMKVPLVVAPPAKPSGHALGAIRDALARERKVRIRYTALRGTESERVVWPVLLGWFDGLEMLAGWCESREAFRNFRVDRIGAIEVLDERPPRSRRALLAEFRKLEPDVML